MSVLSLISFIHDFTSTVNILCAVKIQIFENVWVQLFGVQPAPGEGLRVVSTDVLFQLDKIPFIAHPVQKPKKGFIHLHVVQHAQPITLHWDVTYLYTDIMDEALTHAVQRVLICSFKAPGFKDISFIMVLCGEMFFGPQGIFSLQYCEQLLSQIGSKTEWQLQALLIHSWLYGGVAVSLCQITFG